MFSFGAYEQQINDQSQYDEAFLQSQLYTEENNMMDVDSGVSTTFQFAPSSLEQSNSMVHHMAPTTPSVTNHHGQLGFASQQSKASQLRILAIRHRPDPNLCRPPQPMFSPSYHDDRLPYTLGHKAMPPDVGISPGTYLARPYVDSTSANLQPNHYYASNVPSAPGSMIWSSSAPEAPVPMTRENSSLGNPYAVNIEKFASLGAYDSSGESTMLGSKARSMDEPAFKSGDQRLLAIGGIFDVETPRQNSSSSSTATLLQPPNSTSAQIERSDSRISMRSNASHRRVRKAAERVIKNQKAPIAPKAQPDSGSRVHRSGLLNVGVKSATKSRKNRKPTPPKLFCEICNDLKLRFKGGHELRRHIKAKHMALTQKFFCRDPAQVNIQSNLRIVNPLHKCKHCSSGKLYGQQYGAVAHLRRAHFSEKTARGRGKAPVSSKGGLGDEETDTYPPNDDLKLWVESVQVTNDRPPLPRAHDKIVENGVAGSRAHNVNGMATEDDIDLEDVVHMYPAEGLHAGLFNGVERAFTDKRDRETSPVVDTPADPGPFNGFNDADDVGDGDDGYLGQYQFSQQYDYETCDPLDLFQRS